MLCNGVPRATIDKEEPILTTEKEATKNQPEKSTHIPGIYNYCDRWCERCPFTSRCLNFEMSEENFGDLENADITNEVLWKAQ